jgi:hypothetical protein
MCWFQGEDSLKFKRHIACIKQWRKLNSTWEVNVLSDKTIGNYVPEYFNYEKIAPINHPKTKKSNLLRLLLLSKFGGVWVDATVFPIIPLDDFIDDVLNETGFFTYRFIPRCILESGIRETVSWFIVCQKSNNYLVEKWSEKYIDFYLKNTKWERYFQMHTLLSELYDTDFKVKHIIDNMVQISERIPHSATGDLENRRKSYMYKYPDMNHLNHLLEKGSC